MDKWSWAYYMQIEVRLSRNYKHVSGGHHVIVLHQE